LIYALGGLAIAQEVIWFWALIGVPDLGRVLTVPQIIAWLVSSL
jgi:hypothetical protein